MVDMVLEDDMPGCADAKIPRVIVTGSRHWNCRAEVDRALAWAWIKYDAELVVVHGCAPGVDSMARDWAQQHGVIDEPHPAAWDRHGKAAGVIRNQEMIDAGAELVIAFPLAGGRGTQDCMRRAEKAGIPVWQPSLDELPGDDRAHATTDDQP